MKKKVIIVAVIILILTVWGIQVYTFNKKYPDSKREVYNMGEMVPFEKDVVYLVSMEGYEVRVDESTICTYEEFLEKYNVSAEKKKEIDEYYMAPPQKIYDIVITLKNNKSTAEGVYFAEWLVQSNDIYIDFNEMLFSAANPDIPGSAVALRDNTEMQFHLTYNLREERFTKKAWSNIENYKMWLTITDYPKKKMIALN